MTTDWRHPETRDEPWVPAYINTSLATPVGYRPPAVPAKVRLIDGSAAQAPDGETSGVPDHVLLGRGELSALRHTLVVLNPLTWASPLDAAAAVARLSCVGATVVTGQLPEAVRELLPGDLIRLCDVLDPANSVASDQHENLSIGVRRAAHRSFGHHPSSDGHTPSVAVLIDPSTDSAARLETEFARQENVKVSIVRVTDFGEGLGLPAETAADDVLYVADTRPDVTYGPHHLEDLMLALRHSGADLAFSPDRFEHQPREGVLLEDAAVPIETMLPLKAAPRSGTSLWYRSAGSARPRLSYAVHGCQSVVLPTSRDPREQRTHGRVRRSVPAQLSWARDVVTAAAAPAPSYIARAEVAARN